MGRLAGLRRSARLVRRVAGQPADRGPVRGARPGRTARCRTTRWRCSSRSGPENAYQFEQWRLPLEALAMRRPVVVIVDRPDTGRLVLATSTLPVAFARGSGELETAGGAAPVRGGALRQPGRAELPDAPLRRARAHPDRARRERQGRQRLQPAQGVRLHLHRRPGRVGTGWPAALYDFDADARIREVGRPAARPRSHPGAPDWSTTGGCGCSYAPTWEGDRASIAYGSLVSHGVGDHRGAARRPGVRVIYRPHPRTGRASAAPRSGRRRDPGRPGRRRGPAPGRHRPVRLAVAVRRRTASPTCQRWPTTGWPPASRW